MHVNVRGNPHTLGDQVSERFLASFVAAITKPFTDGSGRLDLADDIVASPLAARVIVNRVWRWHFGSGIVETPDNFGKMGDPPSDPELLEYLASSFVKNGMSIKKLQREILLSSDVSTQQRNHRPRTPRRMARTGSIGAPTGSAWMPKRSAIRCCLWPATWI